MSVRAALTIVSSTNGAPSSAEHAIDQLIAGEAPPSGLLQQLYGWVADEPLPERMTSLLAAWRERRESLRESASDGVVAIILP